MEDLGWGKEVLAPKTGVLGVRKETREALNSENLKLSKLYFSSSLNMYLIAGL